MRRIDEKQVDMVEYYCSECDEYFWTTKEHEELFCPFCKEPSYIN